MAPLLQETLDTVIVGNGPAALILSYILHGHIPYYSGDLEDRLVDPQLLRSPDLTLVSPAVCNLTRASDRYSSQALPVNALLEGLLRPNGDTEIDFQSCIEWRYEPERAVSHTVLGNAPSAGGLWANNPVEASGDIGTLSYAEQLNLPGYSFAHHWDVAMKEQPPDMVRPTRNEVASYLRAYPDAANISDSVRNSTDVSKITRVPDGGFYVEPIGIYCKHLVLATGVFHINLPAPSFLRPLAPLRSADHSPLLVVGSGFTAADIIISTPPDRKIIHLFNWDPVDHSSPLKACHGSAYPEYAWIYRQMNLAHKQARRKQIRGAPTSATSYVRQRNWTETYEGFPNSRIISIAVNKSQQGEAPTATVEIGRFSEGLTTTRTVASFEYAVGRRGSLAYLDPSLRKQVLSSTQPSDTPPRHQHEHAAIKPAKIFSISPITDPHDAMQNTQPDLPKHHDFASDKAALDSGVINRLTFRSKIELQSEQAAGIDADGAVNHDGTVDPAAAAGLELAPDVFAIGSLTGDTLIRFAYGGCAVVAGSIMQRSKATSAVPGAAAPAGVAGS